MLRFKASAYVPPPLLTALGLRWYGQYDHPHNQKIAKNVDMLIYLPSIFCWETKYDSRMGFCLKMIFDR